jgi:branched-chain amino acid transport system permease protein
VQPYLAVVLASLISAVLAVALAPLLLRLRGGQFAVGTWVVAEALALLIALDSDIGGGTGVSLRGLNTLARTGAGRTPTG